MAQVACPPSLATSGMIACPQLGRLILTIVAAAGPLLSFGLGGMPQYGLPAVEIPLHRCPDLADDTLDRHRDYRRQLEDVAAEGKP